MTDRLPQIFLRNQTDDFVMGADAQQFLSKGGIIIRMRGLPYECTPKQVIDFFREGEHSCDVYDGEDGILFVKKPDGRSTGDAFVQFLQESEATNALSKHKELIGTRYIELFRSTPAEVEQVLRKSQETKPRAPVQVPLIAPIPATVPQHIIMSGTKKDCIRLRGLPYEAQVEHILEFLGDNANNIATQGVHMVYNVHGQPSGEAFIQMKSEAFASQAANHCHHRYMTFGKKQRYVEAFQCSGEDMNKFLYSGHVTPKATSVMNPGSPPIYGLPLPVYTVYYPGQPMFDNHFYSQPLFRVLPPPKWCVNYPETYFQPYPAPNSQDLDFAVG
ncbi:UNVERIFIED_CONTAM: hypothetical protein PYX00_004917 [Menopon gallinae]|uniref:RRM domain-containing protein n=1 Tax=Menopon gallinae TaxID=328185 RepID=A0AAW2I6I5_9NEOP